MKRILLPFLFALTAFAQDSPRIGILGEVKLTVNEVIERVLNAETNITVARIAKEEAVLNLKAVFSSRNCRPLL